MMSNNKILTVSYGTFSCTLEGFEDSFDTMKAIAEYFRDLAQDDRYFGAEPPQPDAEMLARIAEREISRRVDAKADDEGIHLRASAAATAAIAAASQTDDVQPDAATELPVAPTQQDDTSDDVADAQSQIQTEDTSPEAIDSNALADETDSVISSIVEDESSEDSVDVNDEEAAFAEDEVVPVADEIALEEPELSSDVEDADPIEETLDTDAFILSALAASSSEDDDQIEDEVLEDTLTDENDDAMEDVVAEDVAFDIEDQPETVLPATSSIAAKLQRIRAVVAKNRASTDGYTEDEHAEDFTKAEEPMVAFDAIEEDIEAESEINAYAFDDESDLDAAAEQSTLQDDEDDTNDELGALISQLGDDADDYEDAEEDVFEATLDADEADDVPAFDEADFASLNEDDLEDAFDDINEEDDTESLIATALTQDTETADEDDMAARGRVISVKREDLEAALEDSASDTSIFADDDEDDVMAGSDLSDEDEDDLMRALAEVEAELSDASLEDEDEDDASDIGNILDGSVAGEEAELDRLMAEADSQMEEPESSSRRSAFNHLRAAVAATKADDKLTEEATSEEDDGAYRTDLAEAVKPRRPSVADTDAQGQRPQTARPAPLKLVAEQRIDDSEKPEGPVSPRRVAAEAPEPIGQGGGFADYAESQGATELSDLLEAAASYLSFVEGRDQFSRPQLMTKVRQVGPEGFTREDGLRSFGQLLRSGKISKIKGGRFTVSDDIGFQPDQRAAG